MNTYIDTLSPERLAEYVTLDYGVNGVTAWALCRDTETGDLVHGRALLIGYYCDDEDCEPDNCPTDWPDTMRRVAWDNMTARGLKPLVGDAGVGGPGYYSPECDECGAPHAGYPKHGGELIVCVECA